VDVLCFSSCEIEEGKKDIKEESFVKELFEGIVLLNIGEVETSN